MTSSANGHAGGSPADGASSPHVHEEVTISPNPADHDELLSRRYRLSDQVVIDRLGGSLVAVQLGTDRIFELNETATRLVELLKDGRTAADAARAIATEYDVTVDTVRADVADTIATLTAESVIEVAQDHM